MKRKLQFSEWFWDSEFCGTTGFETLLKRLKDGRHMCKDVEDFLRTRARIEEDYAKQLHKLAKSAGGNTEMGTLRNSWDTIKLQTEAISEEHMEAHQAILDAANRVSEFSDRQKLVKKLEEETMKKSIKKKNDCYKRVMDTKKSYESKSRDADTTKEQAKAAQQSQNTQAKEVDKLHTKAQRASQEASKADDNYKHAVEQLEVQRKSWENDLIRTCEEFEKLEDVRISWLRNELWVHTNIVSQLCVDNDNHCEEMRKVLERCDVDQDLTEFIDKHKTGKERPVRIPYHPYQGNVYARPPAPLPVSPK